MVVFTLTVAMGTNMAVGEPVSFQDRATETQRHGVIFPKCRRCLAA